MDAIKNILTRKSIRKFTNQGIEREKLEKVLDCALHSPTAKNAQNRLFTVLTKKEDIHKFAEAIRTALGREKYDLFNPAAVIIVTVPRDSEMAESDCAIALQTIYLAAHALELGSCWVNQIRNCFDEVGVRAVLSSFGIPEDHVSFGISVLGYPDEDPIAKERKETIVYL